MERQKKTFLTPYEQREKERLMRSGEQTYSKGSVVMNKEFRKLSATREGRQVLMKRIASSGRPEDIKPGRPVPEEFWDLPRPEDPEGLLLKALLEDREQGR